MQRLQKNSVELNLILNPSGMGTSCIYLYHLKKYCYSLRLHCPKASAQVRMGVWSQTLGVARSVLQNVWMHAQTAAPEPLCAVSSGWAPHPPHAQFCTSQESGISDVAGGAHLSSVRM